MLQMMRAIFEKNKWLLILLMLCLLMLVGFFCFWQHTNQLEEKYQQALVLQQEQLQQTQALSKALHISQINAKELQEVYDELETKPPAASFTVSASTLDLAAEHVAERINKHDATLPPAALEKTDRTAVVKNDNEYKVDVLKINLDKAWEISAGIGSHRGDAYIPIGLQRNYAPHKAVEAEVHLLPEDLVKGKIKTSGWEIKQVWRF